MKAVLVGVSLALAAGAPAMAKGPFDGTWVGDVAGTKPPDKPRVYELKGGVYSCKTCVPPYTVKADGAYHPIKGDPYTDEVSVKVVDDHTIRQLSKKGGKEVGSTTTTVAKDGKTATYEFSDSSASNGGAPVTGKGEMARVTTAAPGAHAISGGWRTTKYDTISTNGLSVTFAQDGDSFSMSTPTGQSYTAKLNGPKAPFKGDPGTTDVSLKSTGDRAVTETDMRNGKTVSVIKMTVAADGKTMAVAYTDSLRGTTMTYTARKK